MRASCWMRVVTALVLLGANGCTALREIPRQDYVSRVPGRAVRVLTTTGLRYEFDTAQVEADTLVGFTRRDVEGPIDEFDTVRLPMEQVSSILARRIDWYRTGLVGGLSLAAIVAAGLSRHKSDGGPAPVQPCPKEPCP